VKRRVEAITEYRYLACLLLLCLGSLCLAQEAKVRVINAANGRPLPKQFVSVSFLYDNDKELAAKYSSVLKLETDANGEAHFKFPEPRPAHFSAQVHVDWSHWKCGCAILGSTSDLVLKGIVGPIETIESKKYAGHFEVAPGDMLFVGRPLSFIERLLYPIMKE
jgi:hypothetical protein